MTQYDVEIYQKIEHLIGKKLEEYDVNDKQALILSDSVAEAARIANMVSNDIDSNPFIQHSLLCRKYVRAMPRKASKWEAMMAMTQRTTKTPHYSIRSARAARCTVKALEVAALPRKDRESFERMLFTKVKINR